MKIDKNNCDIINTKEIYLHDAVFCGIKYDYASKKIFVEYELDGYNKHMKYKKMAFCNVIAFEITACEIWGKSPHIFDFEISNENAVTKRMLQSDSGVSNKIDKGFETKLTLSSGDELLVVCEYIIFE